MPPQNPQLSQLSDHTYQHENEYHDHDEDESDDKDDDNEDYVGDDDSIKQLFAHNEPVPPQLTISEGPSLRGDTKCFAKLLVQYPITNQIWSQYEITTTSLSLTQQWERDEIEHRSLLGRSPPPRNFDEKMISTWPLIKR